MLSNGSKSICRVFKKLLPMILRKAVGVPTDKIKNLSKEAANRIYAILVELIVQFVIWKH